MQRLPLGSTRNPLVSVLIPTCGQVRYIAQAVQSALDQTYENIEVVVSDDSADNATSDLLAESFGNKIKYVRNIPPKGRVDNYHFMLYELANGDWVVNLDGDDYFTCKTFIEEAVEAVAEHPDAAFLFARQITKDDNSGEESVNESQVLTSLLGKRGESPPNKTRFVALDGDWLLLNSIYRNIEIPHLASMYRREKAIQVGFYELQISSSDRESLLKLAVGNEVVFLDLVAGVWRRHGRNTTANPAPGEIVANLAMYDNLYQYALEHSSIPRRRLLFWKIWAKYKDSYAHLLIIMRSGDRRKLDEYKTLLGDKEPMVRSLQLLDLRIYMKTLSNH